MKSVVSSIMESWIGIALSAATVVGCAVLTDTTAPPAAAIVGLVLLAGLARPGKLLVAMALAVPGAALVSLDLDRPDWMVLAAAASIVVAAPLVADADGRWGRKLGAAPVAFAIASAGVFACVPDTEEARVLLAVAAVAGVASLVTPLHTLGAAGAMASTGVFVWIAAFDARGRPAAFVGAVAALGLLVWEPLGARIRRSIRGARPPLVHGRAAVLGGLSAHIALVAYASRVVGLEQSVGRAVALAVPAALVGIAVGALLGLGPTNRSPTTRPPTTRPPTA